MNNFDVLRVSELVVGLAVAGEAVVLTVGMHFLSPRPNTWISVKNDLLLAIDAGVGVGLVGLALADAAGSQNGILGICLAVGMTTHFYRHGSRSRMPRDASASTVRSSPSTPSSWRAWWDWQRSSPGRPCRGAGGGSLAVRVASPPDG